MICILSIDGAKYKLWKTQDNEKEFHPVIKDHSKGIFGGEHEDNFENEMFFLRLLE